MNLIGNGAEAKVYYDPKNGLVVKRRVSKGYRVNKIDSGLRKQRTRREAKVLSKIEGFGPKLFEMDDENMEISMEFLEGSLVKEAIEEMNKTKRNNLMKKIGHVVSQIHNKDVIHGDLTTSNMILVGNNPKLIDFGLSFFTEKIEHKAVDIYLLKRALESKHHVHFEELFENFVKGYREKSKESDLILDRLNIVEKRGRYKRKMGS